jgi:hypothetical protein
MALPTGTVAGDFRPVGTPRRGRSASYELMVANDTAGPLATFAYAVEAPSAANRITWNAIVVPPYSGIAVTLDFPLPRRGRSPRVVAELHSEDAHLTLDAEPPRAPTATIVRRTVLSVAACLLLAFGGSAIAESRPQVLALAAPDDVRGGSPFSVAYAVGHSNDVQYSVETPDGLQVRRGKLDPHASAFTVSLPATPLSNGYDLTVTASGPLGTSTRTTHLVALPALPPATAMLTHHRRGARIVALALERDIVRGGDPIVVDYRANAKAGTVRLIDELGTVRAEALLGPGGRSIIEAPLVDADQDLRIVVDAERGGSRDEAEVPVRVLHGDPAAFAVTLPEVPAPAPEPLREMPAPVRDDAADEAALQAPIVVNRVQIAGMPIVVHVVRHEPGLRVSLLGTAGNELSSTDVDPGESTVILPGVLGRARRLAVVATYARGFGSESIVKPIVLRKRGS